MDCIFKIEHIEEFQNALQEIIKNLYIAQKSPESVDIQVAKAAKDEIKRLISDNSFDISKIVECLQSHGWHPERVKYFRSLLEERKSEIIYDAYIHIISEYGETVRDFNWVLKLVFGTSELKSQSYPILQLLLSTTNSNSEQKELSYEVHRDTLSKLIKDLEIYIAS